MKTWIFVLAIFVGLILLAGISSAYFNNVGAIEGKSTNNAIKCENCKNSCTAESNCGSANCGALNGGVCNCSKTSEGCGCGGTGSCGQAECQAAQKGSCGCNKR